MARVNFNDFIVYGDDYTVHPDPPALPQTTSDIWKRRTDLFATPDRTVYDLADLALARDSGKINIHKENVTMSDAAALRSEAAKLLQMAHRIELLSVDDTFLEGTVLRWSRKTDQKTYLYAAIKILQPYRDEVKHLWYVTGDAGPRGGMNMETLRALWINWGVTEVDVFSGEPNLVIGREPEVKSVTQSAPQTNEKPITIVMNE